MKFRLAIAASVAALGLAPMTAVSHAGNCNPNLPAVCTVYNAVCMNGRLCQ